MFKPAAFVVDRSRTIISSLIHGRAISGLDVAWLRREVFGQGEVTREAAEELFAVARSDIAKASEWTPMFVELITRHVVGPAGVVSEAQARWLIECVDRTPSSDALAALVNVVAEARRMPQWLLLAARGRAAGARLDVAPSRASSAN